jgi:formylglycine-generating enzyme required for sulfatase activity
VKGTVTGFLCVVFALTVAFVAKGETGLSRYKESFTSNNGTELDFEMVLIPDGKFTMGSPADQAGRKDDEGPAHQVQLEAFYLCPTETTLKLFLAYYEETNRAKMSHDEVAAGKKKDVDAITGPTPVFGELTMGYGLQNPAIGVTWHNAVTFCRWLSQKTGKTYRLPTEAEWEYAVRCGKNDVFEYGSDVQQIGDYAWYEDNSDGETHQVAQKKPNAWGLYDMAGNVYEWVHDFYDPAAYSSAADARPAVNPQGPAEGKVHVARGGGYDSSPEQLRCASRYFEQKWWRDGDPQIPKSMWWLPNVDVVGFRIARSVEEKVESKAGPAFTAGSDGEYVFDTGILKGVLRKAGRSMGLSSVVHVRSGKRLDRSMGICSPYRVFTTDKRYGTAAWDWPSESKLLDDGAVEVRWPAADDRPFELTAVYRWATSSMLDVVTTVKPKADMSDLEVFMASYFDEAFAMPSVYAGEDGFLQAKEALGNWQMFPRDSRVLEIIRDGRWKKEPNPVDWVIMPQMKKPLGIRRGEKNGPVMVLMSRPKDCFTIAAPYEGETHYSMYMSLLGRDVKAGQTAAAKMRFAVAESDSQADILKLYDEYIRQVE